MAGTAFQRSRYHSTVNAVESLLAELKYIDDAKEYLNEVTDINGAIGDWGMLQGEPVTLGWSVTVTWYVTLPQYPDVDDGYVRAETVSTRLQEIADSATSYASGRIDQWRNGVDEIVTPFESSLQSAAESLYAAASQLDASVAIDAGTAGWGLLTGEWRGEAATNFQEYFVSRFSIVVDRHRLATAAAAGTVAAARVIVGANQGALMEFMVGIRAQLEEQLENRAAGSDGASLADYLKFASTTLSLFSGVAVVTGVGVAAAPWLGLAATALGAAAGAIPDDNQATETFSASSAQEIATKIQETWMERQTSFRADKDEVTTHSEALSAYMSETESYGALHPPAPQIDGVLDSPGEFYHDSSDQYG